MKSTLRIAAFAVLLMLTILLIGVGCSHDDTPGPTNSMTVSALAAEGMVGIKMNAPGDKVEAITKLLPSLNQPTVAHLYNSDWLSIETIMPENQVRKIVPELFELGAQGIGEYPLNKII